MKPFTESLRYEYPLNRNSFVIDCGVYRGDFTHKIYELYECGIDSYEPILEFFNAAIARFKQYHKIQVFHCAVGGSSRIETVKTQGDKSGQYADGPSENVAVIPLSALVVHPVDLLKLNIEGMEYEALGDLIANGKAELCRNIQVQFHSNVPDCERRYWAIREHLLKTHRLTYSEPWCWENYELCKQ